MEDGAVVVAKTTVLMNAVRAVVKHATPEQEVCGAMMYMTLFTWCVGTECWSN